MLIHLVDKHLKCLSTKWITTVYMAVMGHAVHLCSYVHKNFRKPVFRGSLCSYVNKNFRKPVFRSNLCSYVNLTL